MNRKLSAPALLTELGIKDPEDLNIEAMAQYCGATILYEPLEGCAARILGYGDRAIITVDKRSHRARQRFSAGHELGHWILDRGTGSFECEASVYVAEWSSDNAEQRANRYAANLLLPEEMFRPRARDREITFHTVRDLAGKFVTSLTATAIRLVELGSFPALLVCSRRDGRLWFRRGPDVPTSIWPHDHLRPGSLAYDLLSGNGNSAGPVDVYAEDWITPCESKGYGICEHSVRVTSDLVLSLLWWKDEKQLLEITRDEEDSDY